MTALGVEEAEVDGDALVRVPVAGRVEAVAAEELVGAGASFQKVVAVEADDGVVPGEAEDLVGLAGAVERVRRRCR